MKNLTIYLLTFGLLSLSWTACAQLDLHDSPSFEKNDNLTIKTASVKKESSLGILVFEIEVEGQAGESVPTAFGQLDGAPVLGYVFPTSLKAEDVGFSAAEGIVALALTSHPDFDDTPLWDENTDRDYANDGVIWHPHWVVLNQDERVAGGFSVKQFDKEDKTVQLPPTNPGMPMYMDSPGYPVIEDGNMLRVIVPMYRINHQTDFTFDALTCYMQVNGSKKDLPMLGVYKVYSVEGGELALDKQVK